MSHSTSNCDNVLFHVLKECKTLPVFLDAVFGFLKRSTDFYVNSNGLPSSIGLPPGKAESVVKEAFFKWQKMDFYDSLQVSDDNPPPAIQEIEVFDSSETENKTKLKDEKQEDKTIDNPKLIQNLDVSLSECYNGAVNGNHMWSQSINDIEITVSLMKDVVTRHLDVCFQSKRISVKNKVKNEDVLVGELSHSIKHSEVIWWVDANSQLLKFQIDKVQEVWWDRLFVHDEPLDTTKLDCTRPFEELPEEAQAKIEELKYYQDRKQAGLPTSQQWQVEATLKKAWFAEGSPFTGPYDPSKVLMEQNNCF